MNPMEEEVEIKDQSCLEGAGQFSGRMNLKPASITSAAHTLMSKKLSVMYKKSSKYLYLYF